MTTVAASGLATIPLTKIEGFFASLAAKDSLAAKESLAANDFWGSPQIRDRKGIPKNLCDKDFAELSGELSGAICLKKLGKSKRGLSNGGLRPLSPIRAQSSTIVHFCVLLGPFLGPFFLGNFRRKMTTIVGNRGQLWTSTLSLARPNLLKRRTEKIENFKINLGDFEVGWNSVTLEYPCNGEPRPRVSLHQLYAPAACSATSASFSIWKESKLGYGTQNVVCEF